MTATCARALFAAAMLVGIFAATIAIQTRHTPEPKAWCDIRSMNCYEQLGSVR